MAKTIKMLFGLRIRVGASKRIRWGFRSPHKMGQF